MQFFTQIITNDILRRAQNVQSEKSEYPYRNPEMDHDAVESIRHDKLRGTRFTVNGRGLINNQSLDYDKLTDDEMEEVEYLLPLGLEQPRGVPAGAVFYFTDEGLDRHARLIELLMKAARGRVDVETIDLPQNVVWESDDGQVAVMPESSK